MYTRNIVSFFYQKNVCVWQFLDCVAMTRYRCIALLVLQLRHFLFYFLKEFKNRKEDYNTSNQDWWQCFTLFFHTIVLSFRHAVYFFINIVYVDVYLVL